jgi:Neuraminidase (sialidase)
MALQGKITANRVIQSAGGVQSKTIVAKQISVGQGQALASLTDVDVSARDDGSMIIWDNATSKFNVLGAIQNTNLQIIGGSF